MKISENLAFIRNLLVFVALRFSVLGLNHGVVNNDFHHLSFASYLLRSLLITVLSKQKQAWRKNLPLLPLADTAAAKGQR